MVDNYGNYFCQKLLSTCSCDQRLFILTIIQEHFIKICCNKKGTHTIQSMFDLITLNQEEELIFKALKGHIVYLARDAQGAHVVQKVLNTFPEETKRQFIFDEVYQCLIDLAKDSNGLCVIKRLIQLYSPASLDKSQAQEQVALRKKNALAILMKIQESVIDLVQDPFGNYAVSEIIKVSPSGPQFIDLGHQLLQTHFLGNQD